MSKPKKKSKPIKKQSVKRKTTPLKRYNKIVSLIVKDNKKKGIEYNIADVRKQVSQNLYPEFKNVAPSKIRLKQVKALMKGSVKEKEKEPNTVRILAENIPREYFDVTLEWFELGMETTQSGLPNPVLELNRNYPEIPIVIQTGDLRLAIQGEIGDYAGSPLQEYVEQIRTFVDNESGVIFSGVPAWLDRKDKQYALFGTEDVAENLPPEQILDFVDAGLKKPLFDEKKSKPKTKKTKDQDKKKPEKKKPEPKKSEGKLTEVQKVAERKRIMEYYREEIKDVKDEMKELREDFKDGVYDKSEYKTEKKRLSLEKERLIKERESQLNKYEKGGII